jgi:hypothetical protein
MDGNKNVSRETSFAQRKPLPAQQLARICCWNWNEKSVLAACAIRLKTDKQTGLSELLGLRSEPGLL